MSGLAAGVVERHGGVDLGERRKLLAEQAAPARAEAEVDDRDADARSRQAVRLQGIRADALDAL